MREVHNSSPLELDCHKKSILLETLGRSHAKSLAISARDLRVMHEQRNEKNARQFDKDLINRLHLENVPVLTLIILNLHIVLEN